MKGKVYLSKKFYVGKPFSVIDPQVELSALNSLKKMLLDYEAYEKVRFVQNRIDEVNEELDMENCLALLLTEFKICIATNSDTD